VGGDQADRYFGYVKAAFALSFIQCLEQFIAMGLGEDGWTFKSFFCHCRAFSWLCISNYNPTVTVSHQQREFALSCCVPDFSYPSYYTAKDCTHCLYNSIML